MEKHKTENGNSGATVVYSCLGSYIDKQERCLSSIRERIKLAEKLLEAAKSGVKDSDAIGKECIEKIKINIFKLEIIERQMLEGFKDLLLIEKNSNKDLESLDLGIEQ